MHPLGLNSYRAKAPRGECLFCTRRVTGKRVICGNAPCEKAYIRADMRDRRAERKGFDLGIPDEMVP